MLFEHVGKAGCALEAGLARDLLDRPRAMPQRVDGASEAALDQVSISRVLGGRTKAANEMIPGNADEIGAIGKRDVAVDIGVDRGEDAREMPWREGSSKASRLIISS